MFFAIIKLSILVKGEKYEKSNKKRSFRDK